MNTPTKLRFITPQGEFVEVAYAGPEFGDSTVFKTEEIHPANSSIDLIAESYYEAMVSDDVWKPISYDVMMVLMVPVNKTRAGSNAEMIDVPTVEDFTESLKDD